MSLTVSASLERAILETLAYSDVFDYPLTFDELHRYLTFPASRDELRACLDSVAIHNEDGFYFLPNRSHIVQTRRHRQQTSLPAFRRALTYGRILGRLPFVRMVALTGSLAVLNLSGNADMDYMLVTTAAGRLWLARAFAVAFGRLMRLFGDRICVNVLVSESNLTWKEQGLYSAREFCQMIPITGFDVYFEVRKNNEWTNSFLPNAESMPENTPKETLSVSTLQKVFEFLLRGKIGHLLEAWAMNFQLRKIHRTYGSGMEANFSADLCQGNFHDHRTWTQKSLDERLAMLNEGEHHS